MKLSFIAEPLKSAVEGAIHQDNGTVTQSGNTIQIAGSSDLMRSLIAIDTSLHCEAEKAGLTIELRDSDAELATAGILGKHGAPFGGASRS